MNIPTGNHLKPFTEPTVHVVGSLLRKHINPDLAITAFGRGQLIVKGPEQVQPQVSAFVRGFFAAREHYRRI